MSASCQVAEFLANADCILHRKISYPSGPERFAAEVKQILMPTSKNHREQIAGLTHEISQAKSQNKTISIELKKVESKLEKSSGEVQRISQRLDVTQEEISELKGKIKQLSERLGGFDGEAKEERINQEMKEAAEAEFEVKLLRKVFKVVWDKESPDFIRGYFLDDVEKRVEMFEFSRADRSRYSVAAALWDFCGENR